MKRRILVEYADATPAVRAVYDEAMAAMGLAGVPNWMKALGGNEHVLRATWEKFRHVVLLGRVPLLLKQLILFVISVREDNLYCTAAHGYAAPSLDPMLTCEDLYSLARGKAYASLPQTYQVAIEVVTRAALDPAGLSKQEEDVERRLRAVGFRESEIDELLAQADFGVMMNAITRIWDIPADKDFPPPDVPPDAPPDAPHAPAPVS